MLDDAEAVPVWKKSVSTGRSMRSLLVTEAFRLKQDIWQGSFSLLAPVQFLTHRSFRCHTFPQSRSTPAADETMIRRTRLMVGTAS